MIDSNVLLFCSKTSIFLRPHLIRLFVSTTSFKHQNNCSDFNFQQTNYSSKLNRHYYIRPSTKRLKLVTEQVQKEIYDINNTSWTHKLYQWVYGNKILDRKCDVISEKLYKLCREGLSLQSFYQKLDLPDTFQSWYSIVHLHIWFLLVRLKTEEKRGKVVSYQLIQKFWKDSELKMKSIGIPKVLTQNTIKCSNSSEIMQYLYEFETIVSI